MPASFVIVTADALGQLDGPNSSAYAVEDDFGFHSTSYAYEDSYGATYERNTFQGTFLDGVTEDRAGSYEASGYGDDRTASSQVYTVDSYGAYDTYGPYGYGDAAGKATETTYTARQATYSGDLEQVGVVTQSSIDYRDGSTVSTYTSLTETFSGGASLPGSYALETSSAYTAYGSGDTSYTSSEVLR